MAPILTAAIATAAGAPLLLGTGVSAWATHTVQNGDTLWDLAARHHTDVRTLIRANHLSDGGHLIRAGAVLRVPAGPAVTKRPALAARADSTARYLVRSGDTISDIAARLHVSAGRLLKLNHLDARGRIYAGQYLAVPAQALRVQAKTRAAALAHARWTTYRVRPGDTVSAIAVRIGTTQATVLKANRLGVSSVIRPGQPLRVPRAAAKAASSAQFDQNTFAGRTYPQATVRAAAQNRHRLASRAVPGRAATRRLIVRTAQRYGVDPALALAVSFQESGWNQRQVSVANAIGTMQVIPSSGQWASDLVGRRLNLLDTHDNITAGVVILKALNASAVNRQQAVAGYYQGLSSVRKRGLHADTKQYVRSVLSLTRRFG